MNKFRETYLRSKVQEQVCDVQYVWIQDEDLVSSNEQSTGINSL